MKVKALKDFGYFYKGFNYVVKEGQEIEIDDKIIQGFIRDGLIEEIKEVKETKNKKEVR
ncbi:MAG: hypothetical protein GX452_13930 [Ignavibacteriales bacterium]|nr:hypothetical protein [Ignavibacteriales bacterium]